MNQNLKNMLMTATAIATGIVIYKVVQNTLGGSSIFEKKANASGLCDCGNGKYVAGCKRGCDNCCGVAEKFPELYM